MRADKELALLAGVAASNSFAFELYRQVGAKPGNTFFSPASIAITLAMTGLGARGKTQEQMERVLGVEVTQRTPFHEAYSALSRHLGTFGEGAGVELRVANQLWGQEGYAFLESFLDATKTWYGAPMELLDFEKFPEQARQLINQHVSKRTRGKIRQLISPNVLSDLTRLVITNAIYFKGRWDVPFQEKLTRKDGTFHLPARKQVRVPMMSQGGRYAYTEDSEAQWLELPYVGRDVAMLVALPKQVDGLARLEAMLSAKTLELKVSALTPQRVSLSLPRFTLSAAFELNDALSILGMPLPFDRGRADFSGMVSQAKNDLCISKVLHQADIDVNEEGTVAVASTAMISTVRSLPTKPIVFTADRPFLFLIRDTRSGAVLFLGKMVDPTGA